MRMHEPARLRRVRSALPRLLLRPLVLVPPQFWNVPLNLALGHALRAGDLDFLRGRRLRLEVSDLGLAWILSADGAGLSVLTDRGPADTTIRGKLREFVLLARRREDPDTLFFQRRLVVEGDTELGLAAKNLLDGIDVSALPQPLARLLR